MQPVNLSPEEAAFEEALDRRNCISHNHNVTAYGCDLDAIREAHARSVQAEGEKAYKNGRRDQAQICVEYGCKCRTQLEQGGST